MPLPPTNEQEVKGERTQFKELIEKEVIGALKDALGYEYDPDHPHVLHQQIAQVTSQAVADRIAEELSGSFGTALADRVQDRMRDALHQNEVVNFPRLFRLFVSDSRTRMNEDGNPRRFVSIRTTKAMFRHLNHESIEGDDQ